MFKRFGLMILVNFGVMLTLMAILNLLGVRNYMTASGINYESLMIFCLVYGMGGSFISLLMSKTMAKWLMGVKIIDKAPANPWEHKVVALTRRLSTQAGLPKHPEVGIFDSPEINAFATGPSKSNSLVAVSTGLLKHMNEQEVEGVLAHEVSHIANGDMVTMTLIQGVINAFVMFFAKALAWAIANVMQGDDEDSQPSFWVVFAVEMVLYTIFGLIGGMIVSWFSRGREFRADSGGAKLAGSEKMIAALKSLQNIQNPVYENNGNESFNSLKISPLGSTQTPLKL